MRIVRPICCGADIHKDLIVATIAATNQDGITEWLYQQNGEHILILYEYTDSNNN